jgi:hypothetical protein
MITDSSSTQYQQTGTWYYKQLGCGTFFAENNYYVLNQGWVSVHKNGVCLSRDGEVHQYWEQYIPPGPGQTEEEWANVDLTRFIGIPSPFLSFGIGPWQGQFYGETHYVNSDVPGLSASPVVMNMMQVQNEVTQQYGGTCTAPGFALTPGPNLGWRYSERILGCDSIKTYTV